MHVRVRLYFLLVENLSCLIVPLRLQIILANNNNKKRTTKTDPLSKPSKMVSCRQSTMQNEVPLRQNARRNLPLKAFGFQSANQSVCICFCLFVSFFFALGCVCVFMFLFVLNFVEKYSEMDGVTQLMSHVNRI